MNDMTVGKRIRSQELIDQARETRRLRKEKREACLAGTWVREDEIEEDERVGIEHFCRESGTGVGPMAAEEKQWRWYIYNLTYITQPDHQDNIIQSSLTRMMQEYGSECTETEWKVILRSEATKYARRQRRDESSEIELQRATETPYFIKYLTHRDDRNVDMDTGKGSKIPLLLQHLSSLTYTSSSGRQLNLFSKKRIQALTLLLLHELTYEEAAVEMGVSLSTFKNHIAAAKDLVEKHGGYEQLLLDAELT